MHKFRLWMPKESEERFLNKQAAQGYTLVSIVPFNLIPPIEINYYTFEKVESEPLIYRVDSKKFESATDEQDYVQLLHDDGWKGFKGNSNTGNIFGNNYYFFREKNKYGENDIFSDEASRLDSKNAQYTTLLISSTVLLLLSLILFPFVPIFQESTSKNVVWFILKNLWTISLVITCIFSLVSKIIITIKKKSYD